MTTPLHRRALMAALTLTSVLASTSAAWAQLDRQPRAYRGLFGPASQRSSDQARSLDLLARVDAGHDENLRPARTVSDPRFRLSGQYLGTSLRLAFDKRGRRLDFTALASGQLRRYQTDLPFTTHDLRGGVGLRADLTRQLSLTLNQSVNFAPYFQLDLSPILFNPDFGDGPELTLDFALAPSRLRRLSSRGQLSQRLGRRTTLALTGMRMLSSYGDGIRADTHTWSSGVQLRHEVNRDAAIQIGYRRSETDYEGLPSLERDDIIASLDYRKALSFSRRTSISVSSGSSLYESTTNARRFRVLGNAGIQHDFGRSWSLAGNYSRTVAFVEGFGELVNTDAVRGQLTGNLSRRSQFSGGVGFSNGAQARASARNYSVVLGDATYQFALSATTAAYAQYVQYHYQYAPGFLNDPTLDGRLTRRAVRVGLNFWLPVLR